MFSKFVTSILLKREREREREREGEKKKEEKKNFTRIELIILSETKGMENSLNWADKVSIINILIWFFLIDFQIEPNIVLSCLQIFSSTRI